MNDLANLSSTELLEILDTNNLKKIDADEIKAGSTLILDSDTNSGEIKLGGASDITTGDGIYMAGDKKFRVGQASNNFIRFNNTANILEIKTPALDLDNTEL